MLRETGIKLYQLYVMRRNRSLPYQMGTTTIGSRYRKVNESLYLRQRTLYRKVLHSGSTIKIQSLFTA